MDTIEPVKRLVEKATGIGVPRHDDALARIRAVKPATMKFRDDGYVPNNKWPLLAYRKAIRLGKGDPAALIETIFNANGWGDCWRDGVYFYVHYHSRIHEALGVARGHALLRLGGNKGKSTKVSAGDVLVVPAGVGHECLRASKDFLVVGGYPPTGTYDECRGSFAERSATLKSVANVKRPAKDPLFGADAGLNAIWR
jgi:uncharacterized protein YjlB